MVYIRDLVCVFVNFPVSFNAFYLDSFFFMQMQNRFLLHANLKSRTNDHVFTTPETNNKYLRMCSA